MKVYLAGPMDGLTAWDAHVWRSAAALALASHGIEAFSPLRGKVRDPSEVIVDNRRFPDRFINARDHNDCMTSDAILVNLLGAKKVSVGTTMEIAWAKAYRKPLIVAMELSGNPHDHPMVRDCIDFWATDLTSAIELVVDVLRPTRCHVVQTPEALFGGKRA